MCAVSFHFQIRSGISIYVERVDTIDLVDRLTGETGNLIHYYFVLQATIKRRYM